MTAEEFIEIANKNLDEIKNQTKDEELILRTNLDFAKKYINELYKKVCT